MHLEPLVVDNLPFVTSNTKLEENFDSNATAETLASKGNEGQRSRDPHTCCLCQKVISRRCELVEHLETVHFKATKIFCDLCPKFYFTKKSILWHMQIHMQKSFQCNVCDYKTPFKNFFYRHKFTHAEKVECPTCKKLVSSLKIHMDIHKPKKSCPICQKLIKKKCLEDHIKTHVTFYECDDCTRKFENKEALRR